MIRLAMLQDIPGAMPLVEAFYDESLKAFGFNLNKNILTVIMTEHCNNQSALVMEEEGRIVGVIAGKFVQFPISDYKIFQEVIWYVLPEYRKHGIRLFKETEKHCKSIGMQAVIMGNMANLNNEKMGKFYASQGYKTLEVQWIKIL